MPEHDAANKIKERRRDPEREKKREPKNRSQKWLVSLPLITSLVERERSRESNAKQRQRVRQGVYFIFNSNQ